MDTPTSGYPGGVTPISHARIRGELDLGALREKDRTGLLAEIDRIVVWDIALTNRFRGLTRRDGILLHGPAGWGEVAPFWDYDADVSAPWLAAALETATGIGPGGAPAPQHPVVRAHIPVNVTIPEVGEQQAREMVVSSGCRTAKVKVAGRRDSMRKDIKRLEAVRDALGPEGRVRIDANGCWDLDAAARHIPILDRAAGGLEYVEQPCSDVHDLAALRKRLSVPIAADESIRLSDDPLAVTRLRAADLAILKAAPLGGVTRALAMAERLGLPTVVSSSLDTTIGLSEGARLAAALPVLGRACGLGTIRLLARDVAVPSAVPVNGSLAVRKPHLSKAILGAVLAGEETVSRWQPRFTHMLGALAARREREARDASSAVGGLPI